MTHWLVKTEPAVYSIDDLKHDKKTLWDSIRNYQARNYLKTMAVGDTVFIYHSQADIIGIAGLGKVSRLAIPDPIQFDKNSDYFDPAATKDLPRWFAPEITFTQKFSETIPLAELRKQTALKNMVLL